jgi:hypothetical protein
VVGALEAGPRLRQGGQKEKQEQKQKQEQEQEQKQKQVLGCAKDDR